jgi:hypothetical protein
MNLLNSMSNLGTIFANKIKVWTQLGLDIDGEAASDYSGWSVSINSTGSIVAVGARLNTKNTGGSNFYGHVKVYEYNGSSWIQLGSDIDGEANGDQSGYFVSLNSAGNRVAVAANFNDGINGADSGHVKVYEYVGSSWIQLGSDIDGEAANDNSGRSISLNDSGDTVAIGANLNDGTASNAGHVKIYRYNGSSWIQLGTDIDGEATGDYFGASVSLNSTGNIVAIGGYLNNNGYTKVYEYVNSSWQQLGSNILGVFYLEQSGYSVSLNSAGNKVAIGSPSRSFVKVYEYINSSWQQLGSSIVGDSDTRFGDSISLNSAGDIVAIGAYLSDEIPSNSGSTRVYQWNGSIWILLGIKIIGEASSDRSGNSVSLNDSGDTIVIGAYLNNNIGLQAGHARVYKLT